MISVKPESVLGIICIKRPLSDMKSIWINKAQYKNAGISSAVIIKM